MVNITCITLLYSKTFHDFLFSSSKLAFLLSSIFIKMLFCVQIPLQDPAEALPPPKFLSQSYQTVKFL